jgi:hypothetical protein
MEEVLWMALPFVAALGAGVLSFIVAQARMDAAQARDREALVEARTQLVQQQKTAEERVRAAEAEARRQALDEFLGDVQVEERQYLREIESAGERRKCLVLQERIRFRNIPLSQWIERELPVRKELAPEYDAPQHTPIAVLPHPQARRLLR